MTKILRAVLVFQSALLVLNLSAAPARASDVDILINKLVEKNILTRVDAEAIRSEMEAEKKKTAPQDEIKETYVEAVRKTHPWLENLKSQGDLRLRYDVIAQEDEDARDRERGRFRLRWGLEKKISDEWKAGFRLASGSAADATSTNQSFDDEFNLKSVFIDRAYGVFTPEALPAFEFGGGKVANPYEKWGTSIVWDSDVNPEGIYESWDWKLAEWDGPEGGKWDLQTLFGQFVLNESSTGQDSQLLAYGVGTNLAGSKKENLQFSVVLYDWNDYTDLIKSGSVLTATNPAGNDTEIDQFRVLSFYLEGNRPVATPWGERNLKLFGHFIHNTEEGEDVDGEPMTPNGNNDDGYSAGFQIGKAKKRGEWEGRYQYSYIEPNSTPGNFVESDLGLGGTNNKGHQLQFAYRVHENIQLGLGFSFSERIARTTAAQDQDREISRWTADLLYNF